MRLQSETIIALILLIAGALATIIIFNIISPNLNIINPSGQEISRSLKLNFQLLDYFIANNTLYAYIKPSEPVNYSQVFAIVNDRLVNVYPYNPNGSIVNPYNNGLLIIVANLSQIPPDQNGNYQLEVGLENDILGIFTIKYISNSLINYFQPPIAFNISTSASSTPTAPICQASYLPLILYNTQSISTPSPFQQDIAICNGSINIGPNFAYINNATLFNKINSNGLNIYFTTTCNSTPNIYSWYEGQFTYNGVTCDVWWIKLPNGIPANSNITIYMYIGNISDNYYQQYYPYVGQAPKLSLTYGQYDNGNYVFLFYDNFAGTSLNTSKWSVYGSLTYSVNNGLSVTGSSSCGPGIESIATFSPPIIVEGYASFGSDKSKATNCYISGLGIWYTSGGGSNSGGQITHGWAPDSVKAFAINGWTGPTNSISFWSSADNPQPSPNKYYVWGLGYISPSLAIGYINYQQVSSTTTTIETSGSLTVIIDLQYNNVFPMYYYWFRVRSYPPNGVMPSIYIG